MLLAIAPSMSNLMSSMRLHRRKIGKDNSCLQAAFSGSGTATAVVLTPDASTTPERQVPVRRKPSGKRKTARNMITDGSRQEPSRLYVLLVMKC
jgi:hypothetical protein